MTFVETYHGKIELPGDRKHASGGSLLMSRFRAVDENNVVFASHNQIYHSKISYPEHSTVEWKRGRQGEHISVQVPLGNPPTRPLFETPNEAQIMSIDLAPALQKSGVRVAAVDSVGGTTITTLDTSATDSPDVAEEEEAEENGHKRRRVEAATGTPRAGSSTTIRLQEAEASVHVPREAGWHGVAMDPGSNDVWTASMWNKEIRKYQDGRVVRAVHTSLQPNCIKHLPSGTGNSSACLALAEGNLVSLWDLRSSERGGCLQRFQNSPEEIYTLDANGSYLAAAGQEKTVFVYDLRKMKLVGQWTKALKYEVTSVLLSHHDPELLYTTGLDHEVFCGMWARGSNLNTLKRHGFRGESRWIGIDRVLGSDTLLGITENLHLYSLVHPYRLAGPKPPKSNNRKPQKKQTAGDGSFNRRTGQGHLHLRKD